MNPCKFIASMLSVLLASCSTPRHTGPAGVEDLSRLVLIIREPPDSQVTHSWQSADDFDFRPYERHSGIQSLRGNIVLASSQRRDCHAEYLECHRECKKARLPSNHRHIPRGSVRHDSYCWEKCKQPYLDCEKLQELQRREFTAIDGATDWLKRHHREILVGSIIVIAGVVFVVVSAGVGLVVLVPAVLVASSVSPADHQASLGAP